MIQQENIDILGSLSSNRLDLEASLSDGASESLITSTIFRDLGEGPQHGSIRLANPIKDRFNSFDELSEPLCFREPNTSLLAQLHHVASFSHDPMTTPIMIKPLGCSSNYATSNMTQTASRSNNNPLITAAPPIDFGRYFQEFASVAIDCEPIDGDDLSLSSHPNSILTSDHDDEDDDYDSGLGLYQGSFSWNSHSS